MTGMLFCGCRLLQICHKEYWENNGKYVYNIIGDSCQTESDQVNGSSVLNPNSQ
jgi:hypothetical protein